MATANTFLCTFILSLFFYSSTTTNILDVSASSRHTKHALTFHQQQPLTPTKLTPSSSSSSSSLTFPIHTRLSIQKPHHKTYESLTLSRLRRDSARLNSLNAKLNFTIAKTFNLSDTKQENATTPNITRYNNFKTPVSSGSGEYFARIGLGTPVKHYYMSIDTGSDVSWIQCKPCKTCYKQSGPIYDPFTSSSYQSIPCTCDECEALHSHSCSTPEYSCVYEVIYGDESSTTGYLVAETVSFGNASTIPYFIMGCGHDNKGLFGSSAGLIGLGGGDLSMTSQILAKSFSYCLVNLNSRKSATLEFNSVRPNNSVVVPLLRNSMFPSFYYVGMTGISMEGRMLDIPTSVFEIDVLGRGGILLDSGTTVSHLPIRAYNLLRDTFKNLTTHLREASRLGMFDTCYNLAGVRNISVPELEFHFLGNKTLALPSENYLIPVDSKGKYCFAFAPTLGPLSIIGNVQQQGIHVSYDVRNHDVGFLLNTC